MSTVQFRRQWDAERLDEEYLTWHEQARKDCVREILQMTHLANSGHPGGSMSSLDFYLVLYSHANLNAKDPWAESRDRIVVSHGHTSPGVYSCLSRIGFFSPEEVISHFRRTTNVFEGHIEREVPGVEWTTGNLGQGLSAACGMAVANKLRNVEANYFVPMGDGEQQKGQISEARRFAVQFGLNSVTAIVDLNHQQIGGRIDEIMRQDIVAGWAADGWRVHEIDGHDPQQVYGALRAAVRDTETPHVLIATTAMGKGVSFMEDICDYHGKAVTEEEYHRAAEESGEDLALWNLEPWRALVADPPAKSVPELPKIYPDLVPGTPRQYTSEKNSDNRSAFGNALLDVAEANAKGDFSPFAVFDCDLEGSVKTGAFRARFPQHFFQSGIQEHHTATCSGATSAEGIVTVFADFGVFGIAETYNQHRLTDINHGNLKLVCTHIGLDVGEDGKTHQSIDYVGVLRNLFGMRVIVPADPNQTDRALRYMLTTPGMFFLGMGRSKLPVITAEDGSPRFGGDYRFKPGRADWIRSGQQGAVVAMGTLTGRALQAVEQLQADGVDVGLAHLATPTEVSKEFLDDLSRRRFLVTVEDHNIHTGLGSCLSSALFEHGVAIPHLRLGVERYCPSGSAESVYASQGLDANSMAERIRRFARS